MSTLRNSRPVSHRPRTLSDSQDGTNAPEGAMAELTNLTLDPSTFGAVVPRPAAVRLTDFSTFNTPGVVSSLLVIGDRAYGTIATARFAGKDEPFIYDLDAGAFIAFDGVTTNNVPASPSIFGDWIPPIAAQVGSRVLLTHPGFSGGSGDDAGLVPWLQQIQGDTVSGSVLIRGNPLASPYPPPFVYENVVEGMRIFGPGITLGTTITAVHSEWIETTCTGTAGLPTITVASATGIAPGQLCLLPASVLSIQAFVLTVVGTTVTLNVNLENNAAIGTAVKFFSSQITMSLGATVTQSGTDFTVLGGGEAQQFGWWDMSGYETEIIGAISVTLPMITGDFSVAGIQPGMAVDNVFLVPGTSVVATAEIVCQFSVDVTAGSAALTDVSPTGFPIGGIWPGIGFTISGSGIPLGSTITEWDFVTRVMNISQVATVTGNNVTVTAAGSLIILSAAATATIDYATFTITGGTFEVPLWGAGDTDRNPLIEQPVGVAQFNARAYFADGREGGVPFSDAGFACRRTNATQALVPNNGLAVTAVAPLMLKTPITGGIVQAILAFQGTVCIQQITGDPTTFNLMMNLLPVATGTEAPLSIVPCELGTAFLSPLGLRLVGFDSVLTGPIGASGAGVTQPFQFSVFPSRSCAAAADGVIRITTQGAVSLPPDRREYFYHLPQKAWSGPHTFAARLVQPWRHTFVLVPWNRTRSLWQSDVYPNIQSTYEEDGADLAWIYRTTLLPDTGAIAMNAMVESNLMLAADSGLSIGVVALDEDGNLLDAVAIDVVSTQFRQRSIKWTVPIIFKQLSLRVVGQSDPSIRLGNCYLRYQILGYNSPLDEEGNFLLSDDGVILDNDADEHLTPG